MLALAVALEGAGWHPAGWRAPDARPGDLFTAGYWTDLVREAENGLLDFVTIEDALVLQSTDYDRPDDREDQVRGRLDASLVAAMVAPLTRTIGLVPAVTLPHTEPFHIAKAIATLDHITDGRAGVRLQISGKSHEAANFGRRVIPEVGVPDLTDPDFIAGMTHRFDESAEYAEAIRRLWDSWEAGALVVDGQRFVNHEKLHAVNFTGSDFSVRGPSATPRPPQGHPLVVSLAHVTVPYRFGARAADVVCVTPHATDQVGPIVREVRALQAEAGRADDVVHVFADLVTFLSTKAGDAADRKARLDSLAGAEFRSDAHIFAGTPTELADLLTEWQRHGVSGFRLRPGTLPHDLTAITHDLVPELQRRGLFRTNPPTGSLRHRLGLPTR